MHHRPSRTAPGMPLSAPAPPEPAPLDADALSPLLACLTGTGIPPLVASALRQGLGGIVLFAANVSDPGTAAALAARIRALSGGRALVAIDEEGGEVTRLEARAGSSLPAAAAFGMLEDPALTQEAGRAVGDLLAGLGIAMDLAPVADVATRPGNPVIGMRAFGTTPRQVVRHAGAFAAGLRAAGTLSCAKHFPGHGDTAQDSHVALPRIDLDARTLRREHLAPFLELAAAGAVDAVMTAHVRAPALGEGPASLSSWSTRLLREAGFAGLIITDALDMAGASGGIGLGEACVRALEAGADLLCLGTALRRDDEQVLREAHDAVLAALGSGRLDRAALRRTRARMDALLAGRADGADAGRAADALARMERIGARASRQALRVRGALPGRPPGPVIDARRRRDHAAGSGVDRLTPALERAGLPRGSRGGAPLLLTRLGRADPAEARVLAAHPGALVVHTGVPQLAPAPGEDGPCAVILAPGASRASLDAAAARIAAALPHDPAPTDPVPPGAAPTGPAPSVPARPEPVPSPPEDLS